MQQVGPVRSDRPGFQGVSPCFARVGFYPARASNSWYCIHLATQNRRLAARRGAVARLNPCCGAVWKVQVLKQSQGCGLPSRSLVAWRSFSAGSALGVGVVGLGRLVGLFFFACCGGAHSIAFRVLGYSFVSVRVSRVAGDDRASRHQWAFVSGGRVLRASVSPVCVAGCIS